ncbi:MAG TPA: prephenate dehydrogenase/arogenate dehydrogenase family protein [Gammaproteobacteria bacterium]|nr:prephenate dehydrogenase/arogenate dehydrogenase family protein [Gammaproteobacteria bacterium]
MAQQGKILDTLAVIGVGLIGGSLAGALKASGAVGTVVGVGRNPENLATALDRGFVDHVTTDLAEAVSAADAVLLATPVSTLVKFFPEVVRHLKPGAILTDAGSVKGSVVESARATLGSYFAQFVPAHPIAGRERSGAAAADIDLFRNHWVVLTPVEETDPQALQTVRGMWECVGAKVRCMDTAVHDRILGMTSHLPHAVAYALVQQLGDLDGLEDYSSMTAGGFLDITRVASSDPVMWRDIFVHNADITADLIADHRGVLERLEEIVRRRDGEELEVWFQRAKKLRSELKSAKSRDH